MKEIKSNFHNSKKVWALGHFKLLPNILSNKFATERRVTVKRLNQLFMC